MTTIEMNVAEEINMLRDLIADTKAQIELMIDADMFDDVAATRAELAGYEADLAMYTMPVAPTPAPVVLVVSDELLAVAEAETANAHYRVKCDVEEDQQGVIVGKPTSMNVSLKRGFYSLAEMSACWNATRKFITEQFGNTVVLYRADAPASTHHEDTQVVYMGDEKVARKFAQEGREAKAYTVAVQDIVGLNVQRNGYYEFIVKIK